MRGSSRRSTIDQDKSDETATDEDDARSKCKAKKAPGASRSEATQIELLDITDSTEDESSSSEEIRAKAIYPLHVLKSRVAARSMLNPTQLTRAMSDLAIKNRHVPQDIIEISD